MELGRSKDLNYNHDPSAASRGQAIRNVGFGSPERGETYTDFLKKYRSCNLNSLFLIKVS